MPGTDEPATVGSGLGSKPTTVTRDGSAAPVSSVTVTFSVPVAGSAKSIVSLSPDGNRLKVVIGGDAAPPT